MKSIGVKADLGKKIEEKTGANKLYQGAGEMVLESTGKETLPLSNENYMTYRYTVDKECNIKLYNVYD